MRLRAGRQACRIPKGEGAPKKGKDAQQSRRNGNCDGNCAIHFRTRNRVWRQQPTPTESTSSHNDRTRMSSRKRTKPSEAPSVRSPSPREPFPPIRTQTSRFGHSSLPSAAGTRMTSGPAALHGSSLLQISRALRSTLACNFTNARHPGRWCAEDSLYFAN